MRLNKHHLKRIIKRTITEQEEDYDEEFYEQMEEDANKLNDERADVLFNHIYECLLNLDITGLYRNTQREFLNKYNDIDWNNEDSYWDLPIQLIKKPIPQNGFNIEDLAHALLEEIEKRMEFQSKHENPDSLTDYSDIG
tara:strand:- start:1610 stop:2026 length:417 start_codon:yes stop_codon:yes gene_type:complete